MDKVELTDYVEEISSQKDKSNNKTVKDFIKNMGNITPDKVNTENGIYSDNLSVYFIPIHSSQYVYVCVSEEAIDIRQLENCDSKDEILEVGKSLSDSFRPVSGGKVKANDPLLGSIHSYVANENKDEEFSEAVNDILKVVCGQSNELISLIKKEDRDYDAKVDVLEEIQFNLAISILALEKNNLDELKNMLVEYDKHIDAEFAKKDDFMRKSADVLAKINEQYKSGLDKIRTKYGQDVNTPTSEEVLVRVMTSGHMSLIGNPTEKIDKETLNQIGSNEEAKMAGIAVHGAVMYGKDDPNKPKENDMFVKVKDAGMASELNDFTLKFQKYFDAYNDKYQTSYKELNSKIDELRTKKNTLMDIIENDFSTNVVKGIEGVEASDITIHGMTRDEMLAMYNEVTGLIERVGSNHKKISNEYLGRINELNDLAMEGNIPSDLIKNTSKYAHEGNELLGEINSLKAKAEEHMTLSNYVSETNITNYEVDADDLVFNGENLVVADEYEDTFDEVKPIPITSGDEIIGYINPKDEEEPKREEWDPDALDTVIHYGNGETEVIKGKKSQEIEALKNMSEQVVVLNQGKEEDAIKFDEDLGKKVGL